MLDRDDFMDYIGFRFVTVEAKIDECTAAAKHGKSDITLNANEFTDDEIKYIKNEVEKRLRRK